MEEKNENEQLSFELKEPFSNKLYKFRNRLFYSFKILEAKKFLRDTFVWLFITGSIAAIFLQLYFINDYFNALSAEIPILKMYISPDLRLVSKELIVLFPAISAVVLIVSTFLSARSFQSKKMISLTLLFVTFISIIVATFAILKLISYYNV